MTRACLLILAGLVGVVACHAGCQAQSAPRTPEETCAAACAERAPRCSSDECSRGCNLSLDRIIEREHGNVVACVAREKGACDDPVWAKCATRIGVHVDGGPPAPPPAPPED